MNCNLKISRERRMVYSGRNIYMYLDGLIISKLENGKEVNVEIAPGRHNLGFAIGKTIVTEITFQIEEGMRSCEIICWVEGNGGVTVRLADYNIQHSISERDTLRKIANKAVIGVITALLTLMAVSMVFTYIFLMKI